MPKKTKMLNIFTEKIREENTYFNLTLYIYPSGTVTLGSRAIAYKRFNGCLIPVKKYKQFLSQIIFV